MGRHDGRRAAPAAPWYVLLGRGVLRWLGRLAVGALAGGVVLGTTVWAGTSVEAARTLGIAAAVLVVVASALAGTLPPPPEPPPSADDGAARDRPPRGTP